MPGSPATCWRPSPRDGASIDDVEPTPTADLSSTWALVPLRGLEDAKTRLGAELDPEERLELVIAMASRTLAAARDAQGISGTVLVTADPAAAELAATFGARTIVQRLPGLNAALMEARAVAIELGATAILVLPIDLPAISVAALEALLEAASCANAEPPPDRPVVLAVPDRHGRGTNALLVSPPAAIDPAFGEDSLLSHAEAAAASGATFLRHAGPLTLDVDTGADLLVAEAQGVVASTGRVTHGA
ncbi:MAG: 2-phospho-L-lactate guanylyltransferase [Chloroflexota bacterium]|nr:MAG: 2-phospho-L-lactate guanylyltransferase [Chloroflexota bacterium]